MLASVETVAFGLVLRGGIDDRSRHGCRSSTRRSIQLPLPCAVLLQSLAASAKELCRDTELTGLVPSTMCA